MPAGLSPSGLLIARSATRRADPCDRDDGIEPENVLEHLEDAELHQHQRNGDIEDQPYHPARMTMG